MDWMDHVPRGVPLQWLLGHENPSVRALALTELLDRDAEDKDVVEARQMIADAPYTTRILADQQPQGYWGRPEHFFRKHNHTRFICWKFRHFIYPLISRIAAVFFRQQSPTNN